MPHLLSALLTPTRAPHARLLKHWEGRIVSLLALVRHPHAHHTLACSLADLHASSLARFFPRALTPSSCSLLVLSSPSLSFSFSSPLLFLLSRLAFFSLLSPFSSHFSLLRTDLQFVLYLRAVSAGTVHPKLTPPHLCTVTMTTRALTKKAGVGARERTLLRKNKCGLQSS